jgi:protocatechuate 3,4-dioxygenase beta subunit
VTDPSGAPVVGAAVELHPENRSHVENRRLLDAGEGPSPLATTLSGAHGEWRITAPEGGFWRLRWTAPGFETAWRSLSPLLQARTVDVVLSQRRPGPAAPRSRSRAGEDAPVTTLELRSAGAPVEDGLLLVGEGRRPIGRFSPSGRLRVPPETAGEDLWVQTRDDRLAPVPPRLGSDGLGTLTLEVPLPTSASGRVRNARTNGVIAGAFVWPAGEPWHGTRTAPDGTFSVAASGPAVQGLNAAAVRFRSAEVPYPHEATPVDLLLQPATVLVGRVVDDRGRPVAGAGLRVRRETADRRLVADPIPRAASGPDGFFELPLPGASRYVLAVTQRGSVPPPLLTVAVAEGERLDLGDLRLPRSARLGGTVTNGNGEAVPGGWVAILEPGSETVLADNEIAADGGFLFAGLPAGSPLDLRVTHPEYPTAWIRGLEVTTGGPAVEVVLDSAATLHGRVQDPDGLPVPGAAVTGLLVPALDPEAVGIPLDEPILAHAMADADGGFELRFPAAGHVELEASATGYQTGRRVGSTRPGYGGEDEMVLVLEPAASLEGEVLQPDGEGAAEAEVTIVYEDSGGAIRSVLADAEGRFALDALAPGTVALLARKEGFGSAAVRLALGLGVNRARLALDAGLEVQGTVVDAHGVPVPGALVSIQNAPPFPERAVDQSDHRGAFRLTGLAPGYHEVAAEKTGFAPARIAVEVREVPGPPLVVHLEAAVQVRGRILGAVPGELDGAEVGALGPQGAVRVGRVDLAGGYTIDGLTTGTWTLVASTHAGSRQARRTLEVGAVDAELFVDLDLGEGPVLSGTVRLGGSPLVAARVELVGTAGQGAAHGTTGLRGDFRLSGLVDGVYVLAVSDPEGTVLHREPLEMAGDRTLELDLVATTVVGTVRDARGQPVAGAVVSVAPSRAAEEWTARALTDTEGHFVLSRMPAGSWWLTVTADDRLRARREIDLSGTGPPGEITIEVSD